MTVTGAGGVGKTRLAAEVTRRVPDQFPDGIRFVWLGGVTDAGRVHAELAAAVGAPQVPGRPALDVLAEVLAPRRLLIVLDNCEHVLSAVAELCGFLLRATDDLRILATSRERLRVGGESRYRLWPLELPASGEPTEITRSWAVKLFAERARQAGQRFSLTAEDIPLAARVVTRLDGIPLAIELAAARVEALGMAGLADRIDDALLLLAGNDRLAADRHKGLAAVASWSYQLLTRQEQQVFRRLAVFPGPFGLAAAEAVAGPEAEPVIKRLVDCSLVEPPRPGPDQRMRYSMLHTLRAYGRQRLAEAGEEPEINAALAGLALSVAEQALAGVETDGQELAALRWLDAEDATLVLALNWLLESDPERALWLASALAPWLRLRGRLVEAYGWLDTAAQRAASTGLLWARAQVWLGNLSSTSPDLVGSSRHFSAAINTAGGHGTSRELVDALVGRAVIRMNIGDIAGATEDARRALEVARRTAYPGSEAQALTGLALVAYSGGPGDVRDLARRAGPLLEQGLPGYTGRWLRLVLSFALTGVGDFEAARQFCADGLARARDVTDLVNLVCLLVTMAKLERGLGHPADAGAHLGEAAEIAARTANHVGLITCIDQCAQLCEATGRQEAAVTLWAALDAGRRHAGSPSTPGDETIQRERIRRIERGLTPAQLREAEERGARMSLTAAGELVMMLTAEETQLTGSAQIAGMLSARERELVVLVAQGHTNAEIAARLSISVRTVGSHLDRIRDKTGCRRRADLTRLALQEGLV